MYVRLAGFIVLAASTFALAPAAHAQYSHEYDTCMARAHNNTVQNGMCSQQELGKQDARVEQGIPGPDGAVQRTGEEA